MPMKLSSILVCALLVGLGSACNLNSSAYSSTQEPAAHSVERKQAAFIEQGYAALRKQQIGAVNYQLHMELGETSTTFSGDVIIDFNLANNNKMPVTVDFDGGEIAAITLNGKAVEWQYNQWFISLAPELFVAGKNSLQIRFTRPYATAGDGLHRYKDKETGKVYLYSNFEPFNAHKMFPHFDQPDIKASYKLDVIAPQSWQVISATRETQVTAQGDKKHWMFAVTAAMSSYVFPLHAGPYAVWEDNSGSVPLRLFARQEMAQYVNHQEWFVFTQQAFSFFNQYFEYPYPFVKYDQLIVPDFNSGAMENIGAVTFNETFISRGTKTYLQRMRTSNVISHEMAHMWFGDLVTMDWWNGLWLNESFATYMATLQQAANTEFKKDAWNVFYADMKQWAYTTDQLVTTHAIELPVANTAEAFTNFDGITYGKGAAVLKQLAVFVGEENFRLGVAAYLKKYAYGNTRLKDFMDEVGKAAKQDLTGWSQEWLYKAGLNTITVDYQCVGEGNLAKLKTLEIIQTAPKENPVLRHQRVQLGLYNINQEKISLNKIIPIHYKAERTPIAEAKGLTCPAFVYPNVADWGYAKIKLDKQSRQTLLTHLPEFDADLRKMLWQNLWDDVEDANMSLTEYVSFVQKSISQEADLQLVGTVLGKLQSASIYFWIMNQAGQDHKADLLMLETIAQQQLARAEAASNFQKVAFDAYVALIHTPVGLETLRNYLSNKNLPQDFVLDQDRRWALLRRLNQFQFKDYRELTAVEAQKDKSDLGQQMAIVSEVIRPELAVKEKWFTELVASGTPHKYATLRLVMRSLFPSNQLNLRTGFDARILEKLPELQMRNNERFLSVYADTLTSPRACTSASVQRLADVRNQYASLSPALKKSLSVNVQEEQRCVDMMRLMNTK
jgi:aminopeptidase N